MLARALCGDLYRLDALLHHSDLNELLDSFSSDSTLWREHLKEATTTEKKVLKQLIMKKSNQLNTQVLEGFIKSSYASIEKAIGEGVAPPVSTTGLFSYAILGRLAFELHSGCMAEGAFLYGLWLTTQPHHATTELDVTLESRQSRNAFDSVWGKNFTPAFFFHSVYSPDAVNTTFSSLEQVHRRSGLYWMRLAKNLGLTPYPNLNVLDQALDRTIDVTPKKERLIPINHYH